MMKAQPEAEVHRESEREKVYRWREDELEHAGYTVLHAERLALDFNIDLHDAVNLLRNGCDEQVAFEIMCG